MTSPRYTEHLPPTHTMYTPYTFTNHYVNAMHLPCIYQVHPKYILSAYCVHAVYIVLYIVLHLRNCVRVGRIP